jgi:putative RecB family exonuclease
MRYSHSSIETFKQCSLKFKFNYITKPDIVIKQGIEAFLGNRVHETLEKLYKDLKFKKLNTIEELINYYYKQWNNNYNEQLIENVREKDYSTTHFKEMGVDFITNYYNKYKPFDQGKTIGLELQITLDFKNEKTNENYNLVGYIDRLVMIDETYFEIHDYKTSNQTKTQEEIEKDKQLALYSIAIKRMYPSVEKIDLIWHFLESGMEMRTSKSAEELKLLEKEIINNIETIEIAKQNDDFKAKASALCNWCAFKSICPLKGHEIKTKELEENEFINEDGVKLVDEYTKLETLKKELTKDIDVKLEKIKEALIIYSKKNNFEKIIGSNNSLLVREYSSIKLPTKDTKKREELVFFIKESNMWDQFSDLSYIELNNALSSNMYNENFKEVLRKYIEESKIYRFYLNKK